MASLSNSAEQNYQKVAVSDIKIGMYVTSVFNSQRQFDFKAGMVTSDATCAMLQKAGVVEVMIDLNKSQHLKKEIEENPESNLAPDIYPEPAKTPYEKKESREKASRLYEEAKQLQSKLLNSLRNGEIVDIAPLEEIADELVDSIFRNNDATMLLSKIREKDSYLMEHSLNVGMLLANFGRYLHLPRDTIKQLLVGGLLHDTGKILIPDSILHKPGKLTADEFEIMKQHVLFSVDFLRDAEGITEIMHTVAANHHERLDGLGYPYGLKGEELCLFSRMSTIVDVYDALTADRCYKKGMPSTMAFRILLQGAGTQFDSTLVNRFIKCMGVYPIGTLLKLKSGKLGIVIERNEENPILPILKVIYSTTAKRHTEVRIVDLLKSPQEEIEGVVDPKDYGIDVAKFY